MTLKPGESKTVEFTLAPDAFSLYDADLNKVVEPGDFTIYVGPDSTTQNSVSIKLTDR